jgi:hypothetical protein
MAMNHNTKQKLILALRLVIGVLFIFSAVAKLYPIEAFEKQLVDLGFASWASAPFLSRAIIGFEAFLGIAFFQKNYVRSIIIPATSFLLIAFCAHLSYVIYTTGGNSGNCGCFGQLLPMTPIEALVKNILTLGLLGYLYSLTKKYETKKIILPLVLVGGTYLTLFITFPIKSYVTDFTPAIDSTLMHTEQLIEHDSASNTVNTIIDSVKQEITHTIVKKEKTTIAQSDTSKKNKVVVKNTVVYTPKTSIYASFKNYSDGITANVDKGTSIVALLSLECEHCMETARKIGELSKEQKIPPVYFLFFGSPGELDHFFEVAQYRFPYKIIEPQVFFPLLGDNPAPPRVSVLKEGNMIADYNFESFSKEKLKKAIE